MFAQTKLAIQCEWATRLFQMPRFCFSSILFSGIWMFEYFRLMTSVTGSAFSVAIRGQIANVTLPQLAGMDIACKYSYEVGPDWQVASGLEEGFSQVKYSWRVSHSQFGHFIGWQFILF